MTCFPFLFVPTDPQSSECQIMRPLLCHCIFEFVNCKLCKMTSLCGEAIVQFRVWGCVKNAATSLRAGDRFPSQSCSVMAPKYMILGVPPAGAAVNFGRLLEHPFSARDYPLCCLCFFMRSDSSTARKPSTPPPRPDQSGQREQHRLGVSLLQRVKESLQKV
jgi:hypothetical protein